MLICPENMKQLSYEFLRTGIDKIWIERGTDEWHLQYPFVQNLAKG